MNPNHTQSNQKYGENYLEQYSGSLISSAQPPSEEPLSSVDNVTTQEANPALLDYANRTIKQDMTISLQEPDYLSPDLNRHNSRASRRTEHVDTKPKEVVGSGNQSKKQRSRSPEPGVVREPNKENSRELESDSQKHEISGRFVSDSG